MKTKNVIPESRREVALNLTVLTAVRVCVCLCVCIPFIFFNKKNTVYVVAAIVFVCANEDFTGTHYHWTVPSASGSNI